MSEPFIEIFFTGSDRVRVATIIYATGGREERREKRIIGNNKDR